MGAIANEFVQNAGNEGEGFGVVQADTAGQAALSELAELGDDKLVELRAYKSVEVDLSCVGL